jgi:hypothetical protein
LSLLVFFSWIVGTFLLAAAVAKAHDRLGAEVGLATYGVPRWVRLPLVAVETALAAGVLAGWQWAGLAAAGLLAAFALGQAGFLAAGRGGMPCGCLGGRGRLSWTSALRTAALAGLAVLGAGHAVPGWALVAAAGVAVLTLRRAPDAALEVAGEGPEVGAATALAEFLPDAPIRLAVFTSEGCRLCKALRPALAPFTREPGLAVQFFDEVADAPAWRAAEVPGSPFVVAVGPDGTALAKGTVNKAEHVASIVAAARERSAPEPPALVEADSRRGFLAKAGGAVAAITAGRTLGTLVAPGEAEAYHFCGHIYTTDGCPHPTGLPRIDSRGFPLRARDGKRIDDLGRPIDKEGRPLDEDGNLLTDASGRPLPVATRTRVCTSVARRFRIKTQVDGAWYRCCGGNVRKLVDCCSTHRNRINGDRALRGYCYRNRKVFCVMYFQTKVPC